METEILSIIGGAGVVVALVEVVKRTTGLPTRFVPIVCVAVGIGLALLVRADNTLIDTDFSWTAAALSGLTTGLAAVGLHSGGTNVAGR